MTRRSNDSARRITKQPGLESTCTFKQSHFQSLEIVPMEKRASMELEPKRRALSQKMSWTTLSTQRVKGASLWLAKRWNRLFHTPTTGCTRSSTSARTSGSSRFSRSMVASSIPNALSDLEWSIHYRPSPEPTVSSWKNGRRRTATTSTKPWDTTSDERKCGRRLLAEGERHFPGSDVMKPDVWTSWNSCITHGSSITSKSKRRMTDLLMLTTERSASRPWSRLFGQSFKRRIKSASNSYASFSIQRLSSPMITSRASWESVMTSMISLRNVVKSS